MQMRWKILISILILASIGLVVGNHSTDTSTVTPSLQGNQGSIVGDLTSAAALASEKSYVGSIKSNKYHYPDCRAAKKIKPENEIWFSSSEDARAHGYEPCGICNPP